MGVRRDFWLALNYSSIMKLSKRKNSSNFFSAPFPFRRMCYHRPHYYLPMPLTGFSKSKSEKNESKLFLIVFKPSVRSLADIFVKFTLDCKSSATGWNFLLLLIIHYYWGHFLDFLWFLSYLFQSGCSPDPTTNYRLIT